MARAISLYFVFTCTCSATSCNNARLPLGGSRETDRRCDSDSNDSTQHLTNCSFHEVDFRALVNRGGLPKVQFYVVLVQSIKMSSRPTFRPENAKNHSVKSLFNGFFAKVRKRLESVFAADTLVLGALMMGACFILFRFVSCAHFAPF